MSATARQKTSGEAWGVQLGTRLRHARMVRGLKLREVADEAGCSESLLSKVENGHANPSLQMLHRIANALALNLNALFAPGEGEPGIVSRNGTRPLIETDSLRHGSGITLERLIPYGGGHLLQGNIHHIEPGGRSEGVIEHAGEEVGYVVEGALELTVDGHLHLLSAGDSFHFDSRKPHWYRNPGATRTQVIWVNTPPTF